jgi:DNA polymerase-1
MVARVMQVREWQNQVIARARQDGYTRTLMGRYRELPQINSSSAYARGHASRAAINTPIQGTVSVVDRAG